MKAILLAYNQGNAPSQSVAPDYTISRFAELPQAVNFFARSVW
jgi:hypothetical protein